MRRLLFCLLLFPFLGKSIAQSVTSSGKTNFNNNWEFIKDVDTAAVTTSFATHSDTKYSWEKIYLPHTPRLEPIEKTEEQWQGTCYYRKTFSMPAANRGKHVALQFDAAMHEADVYLNGKHIYKHTGGFLPFYIDISDKVLFGKNNIVLVKLNNEDNAVIPPGKPIKELDFNYYGGIYRNTWLIVKDKLHISDAVAARKDAGGGVLLHYEAVNDQQATLIVATDVENDFTKPHTAQVKLILKDQAGNEIEEATTPQQTISNNNHTTFLQQFIIKTPKLWSPENPYLYGLSVQVWQNGKMTDEQIQRTGVKTFAFSGEHFILNNQVVFLRGTNRHQEYPYVGYALSDNAQYRDAYKIKEAGFNFVRCSHYPPSPAFLDACDELGILVMNSIPGWQFFGNEQFQNNCYQNIRDMIHRDRNRACIVLWEASLNETTMTKEFMTKAQNIVHKELPFRDVYTCGWLEDVYDVFIPARQHAKAPDYWKSYSKKPILIAEYGDWEYYAQNAGFNQAAFKDLKAEERTSRQLRAAGEKAMLQQALNYQEAHNDDLHGTAVGDANWLLFDYKRGYASDIESSGIIDINRLPKFTFYFYQSQYRPAKASTRFGEPMIFIANYWDNPATKEVKVFSNCDEISLLLNGKEIARQYPDSNHLSNKLAHPPFTFYIHTYEPGTLKAVGYIKGVETVQTMQRTPDEPVAVKIAMDISGKQLATNAPDIIFVHANIVDKNETTVPGATKLVKFTVKGHAQIIGENPVKAEAGIATILLKSNDGTGSIEVSASSENIKSDTAVIIAGTGSRAVSVNK